MAHPMQEHRAHKHEKSRVSHIAGISGGEPKHYARGGTVHSDEAEDKALIRKEVKSEALKSDGKKAKHRADKVARRAKGGKVNHSKSGKTSVNVIVAPGGGAKPPMLPPGAGMAPPPAAAAPPMPPRPPMAAPPSGPPAMGPPPGPGGMPIRSSGGRAYAKGGSVNSAEKGYGPKSGADKKGVTGIGDRTPIQHSGNKSDGQNIGRGKPITYATGGKVRRDEGGGVNIRDMVVRGRPVDSSGKMLKEGDPDSPPVAVSRRGRATGGAIYSDGREGKQMGPKIGYGNNGLGRLKKAKVETGKTHEAWEPGIT